MTKKELEDIVDELKSAGPVLKLAIKTYLAMPESEGKRELAKAIKEAQSDLRTLDVILEDIQYDLEALQVEKDLDKMDKTCYN